MSTSSLVVALKLLARVHSREVADYGWETVMQPVLPPDVSLGQYARAWAIVREAVGLPS